MNGSYSSGSLSISPHPLCGPTRNFGAPHSIEVVDGEASRSYRQQSGYNDGWSTAELYRSDDLDRGDDKKNKCRHDHDEMVGHRFSEGKDGLFLLDSLASHRAYYTRIPAI